MLTNENLNDDQLLPEDTSNSNDSENNLKSTNQENPTEDTTNTNEETPLNKVEETSEEKVEIVEPKENPILEKEIETTDTDEVAAYEISDDHDVDSDVNYDELSKEQLLEEAKKLLHSKDLNAASKAIKNARNAMDNILQEENNVALEKFIEDGNDKDDFEPKPDEIKQAFFEIVKEIQHKKTKERERVEKEKHENLVKKRTILEKLKELTEKDETDKSLEEVKNLQNEWRMIKYIPKEYVQELWDSYKFYMDKFYDNVSINNELKDLDRKKNLDLKIELCQKVQELMDDKSIKKSMIMLNKFHEDWKNIGPVPNEYSEELWKRFKDASDKVYETRKAEIEKLQEERNQNLQLKQALIEKLELVSNLIYQSPKEWIDKAKEIQTVFDEWKNIGRVPMEKNQEIWDKFRGLRNQFYNNKNDYFKKINHERTENLKAKIALCEKAEEAVKGTDNNKITNELKRLQTEWKKIGSVSDKHSQEVWNRFRAICDTFFQQKEEAYKSQHGEQIANLEKKQAIIEELKTLVNNEDVEKTFARLKEIRNEWNQIGFVPFAQKNDIITQYNDLNDVIYKKLKRNPEEMNEQRLAEHYSELEQMPDGMGRLKSEERKVREKMKFVQGEIQTLENNVGFFNQGNSKNVNPLVKQINEKIAQANERLNRMKAELKVIQKAIKSQENPTA